MLRFNTLHKLRAASPAERQLLVASVLQLAWAWVMIRRLPLQRIVARRRMEAGEDCTPLSPDELAEATRISRAVVSAAAHTPWRSACLEQALAASGLLRRGRIPGTLYLGVARDATQPDGVAAHAWVRCGDLIVTGAGGHERFAVVGKYHW
jgi:hypothetical protein